MGTENRLLDKLSPRELSLIARELRPVELKLRMVISEPEEKIVSVYFVTQGVVSMVNEPAPGEIVEFATVGHEGMVGLPVLLGASSVPSRAIVQIPGRALQMNVPAFRQALEKVPKLEKLLLRYTVALMNQIAQITSCNRLHEVQERCARWLLQTHDRVTSDTYPLTQEFLAQMLGVHRPTVTVAAGMLQQAGLIEYSRGSVTIKDRKGLERASCKCYRLITAEYERLLGGKGD
jgi:CRP-like cAMP-binding protein